MLMVTQSAVCPAGEERIITRITQASCYTASRRQVSQGIEEGIIKNYGTQ